MAPSKLIPDSSAGRSYQETRNPAADATRPVGAGQEDGASRPELLEVSLTFVLAVSADMRQKIARHLGTDGLASYEQTVAFYEEHACVCDDDVVLARAVALDADL